MTTIKNIKHVIKALKTNDNYNSDVLRDALYLIKKHDIDVRSISVEFGDNNEDATINFCRIGDLYNPDSLSDVDVDVGYVLAGLGGAY